MNHLICTLSFVHLGVPPLGFATEQQLLLQQPYSFYTRCYTLPCLFAGKMHALLFLAWKNRVKGRDWYDFEWYARKGIPMNWAHFCERARAFNQAGEAAGEGKQSQQEGDPEGHRHPLADGIAQGKGHADAKQENKIAPKRRHRGKGGSDNDSARGDAEIPKAADGEEEEEQHGNKLSMPIRCQPNIENMPEYFPTDGKNAFQNFF